jgi:hypothetical protein
MSLRACRWSNFGCVPLMNVVALLRGANGRMQNCISHSKDRLWTIMLPNPRFRVLRSRLLLRWQDAQDLQQHSDHCMTSTHDKPQHVDHT